MSALSSTRSRFTEAQPHYMGCTRCGMHACGCPCTTHPLPCCFLVLLGLDELVDAPKNTHVCLSHGRLDGVKILRVNVWRYVHTHACASASVCVCVCVCCVSPASSRSTCGFGACTIRCCMHAQSESRIPRRQTYITDCLSV